MSVVTPIERHKARVADLIERCLNAHDPAVVHEFTSNPRVVEFQTAVLRSFPDLRIELKWVHPPADGEHQDGAAAVASSPSRRATIRYPLVMGQWNLSRHGQRRPTSFGTDLPGQGRVMSFRRS